MFLFYFWCLNREVSDLEVISVISSAFILHSSSIHKCQGSHRGIRRARSGPNWPRSCQLFWVQERVYVLSKVGVTAASGDKRKQLRKMNTLHFFVRTQDHFPAWLLHRDQRCRERMSFWPAAILAAVGVVTWKGYCKEKIMAQMHPRVCMGLCQPSPECKLPVRWQKAHCRSVFCPWWTRGNLPSSARPGVIAWPHWS